MKRAFILSLFCVLVLRTGFAASQSGFGLDAFNRSLSASARGSAVFSPFSFELDSVVFSEAFDALTRAKFAERMGVLNGLENVYKPVYDVYLAGFEKGFRFLDARSFCLPDERKSNTAYRGWMQKSFSAEAFSSGFKKGAESWFRARLDGMMEDFEMNGRGATDSHYSYYDLVYFQCDWLEAFPTNNTRDVAFTRLDGTSTTIPCMCDVRMTDVWKRKTHSVIRIPMSYDSWFYAFLPDEQHTIRDIRGELSSSTLINIVTIFKSVTEIGISHSPAEIVLPMLDITTELDLQQAFAYFHLPVAQMERLQSGITPSCLRQRVRFRMDGRGADGKFVAAKPEDKVCKADSTTRRIALNRPFLFFVYHAETGSIPVVGQFTGL